MWVPEETHFPCHFFRRMREWLVDPPPSFTYCQTKEVIFQQKKCKIVTFWKMERLVCAHEWPIAKKEIEQWEYNGNVFFLFGMG